jgi:hypothetical protein
MVTLGAGHVYPGLGEATHLYRGYDNDCFLFGPFPPVVFVTLLMRFVELTASLKRCELLLLIASSSKTGDVPIHMSGFGS